MSEDFINVVNAMGWDEFWQINEQDSRPLTIEFLCTLKLSDQTRISPLGFSILNILSHGDALA